jgi:uncharacterized protein (TIGR02145 family)
MNKSNIFKSSKFFMNEGDVLHIIFRDEHHIRATLNLTTEVRENTPQAPGTPVAIDATSITSSSFTANWNLQENATGYYLDVHSNPLFPMTDPSDPPVLNNHDAGNNNSHAVTGLDSGREYYYRIRAYNDTGSSQNSNTITTITGLDNVVDGDGNVYTYVTIGTQQWMVENLKTTSYNDGVPIPNLTINGDWIADITGAYCWYNNDEASYKSPYGALYNWYAVNNAHGLAPTGWRIPTNADWVILRAYAGGDTVAGGKLKEAGLLHWDTPNTDATDEYGFKLTGSGYRLYTTGVFELINIETELWTSEELTSSSAWQWVAANFNAYLTNSGNDKRNGFSVRCIRDL